jgi:hypothetical protein
MAATIATCTGRDRSRVKDAHRLGSESATAEAATRRTFATAHINADGSGYVTVKRDGRTFHAYTFEAETADRSGWTEASPGSLAAAADLGRTMRE